MSLFKHSLVYGVMRLIAAALALYALYDFTHHLSPAEFGWYALLLSAAVFINGMGFSWITNGLIRFYHDNNGKQLLSTAEWGVLLGGFGLAGLATLVLNAMPFTAHARLIGYEGIMLTLSVVLFEFQLEVCRCRHEPMRYGVFRCLNQVITVTLVIGLIAAHPIHQYAVGITAIAVGICALMLWWQHRAFLDWSLFAIEDLRRFFRYGMPFAITLSLGFFLDYADRSFLAHYLGSEAVGLFSAQYSLVQASLTVILSIVYLSGVPWIMRDLHQKAESEISQQMDNYYTLLLAVCLPASVGMMCLATQINHALFGAAFWQTAWLLPILVMNLLINGIRAYYVDLVYQIKQCPQYSLWIALLIAGLDIVGNILLIPKLGLVGAAYACGLALLIGLCVSIVLARSLFKLPLMNRGIQKILLAVGVMVFALHWCPQSVNMGGLFAEVALGAVVYLSLMMGMKFNPQTLAF